jgi:hypothetical protein
LFAGLTAAVAAAMAQLGLSIGVMAWNRFLVTDEALRIPPLMVSFSAMLLVIAGVMVVMMLVAQFWVRQQLQEVIAHRF